MDAGAHKGKSGNGLLISVDTAIKLCDEAGRPAPLLAAMAGIAELQPYTAPALPQAQPLLVSPSGLHTCHMFSYVLSICKHSLMIVCCALQGTVHLPVSSRGHHALFVVMWA